MLLKTSISNQNTSFVISELLMMFYIGFMMAMTTCKEKIEATCYSVVLSLEYSLKINKGRSLSVLYLEMIYSRV